GLLGGSARATERLGLSPYSVSSLVVMLQAGAAGKTRQEIDATLGLEKGCDPVSLQTAAAQLRLRLGLRPRLELGLEFAKENTAGLEIAAVAPGSPAEQALLKAGDVLTRVNGNPIKSKDDLDLALTGTTAIILDVTTKAGPKAVTILLPPNQLAKDQGPPLQHYELTTATGLWGQSG